MDLNVGDYIRFAERVINKGSESNGTIYAKIIGSGPYSEIGVSLSKPLEGKLIYTLPSYFAEKVSEKQYNDQAKLHIYSSQPLSHICNHLWEVVGYGPVTGEEWINCRLCSMKKEEK